MPNNSCPISEPFKWFKARYSDYSSLMGFNSAVAVGNGAIRRHSTGDTNARAYEEEEGNGPAFTRQFSS